MEEDNNVRRFPVRSYQRWRNRVGKYGVPCMVSNRWLQFPKKSRRFSDGEYMIVNVMTDTEEEKPRKLCEMVITREDLLRVLSLVEKQ